MEKIFKFTNCVPSPSAKRSPKGDLNILGVASYLVLGGGELFGFGGWRAIWFWGVASYLVLGGGELFGFGGWRAIWFWGIDSSVKKMRMASYLLFGGGGERFRLSRWRALPRRGLHPPPSEIKYLGKNIFMLRTQSGELFLEEPSTPRCGL